MLTASPATFTLLTTVVLASLWQFTFIKRWINNRLVIIRRWMWIIAKELKRCFIKIREKGTRRRKRTRRRGKRTRSKKPKKVSASTMILSSIWWKVKGWRHSLHDLSPQEIKEMNEEYDHFFRDTLKSPKYIMAPMVGRSDLAFRMMCRKYKCSLCYTPMIRASQIIDTFRRNGKAVDQLFSHKEDRPLIVQLCSDDADEIVAAAKIIEQLGDICDGIDINLGCPQRCARDEHFGAFLMDEPGTVQSMITALCSSCSLPISAKIRILPTMEETLRFTDLLIHSGISMLTVHGRRRERVHHDGPADLDCIRIIKQRYREQYGLTIPIVSNGNITTAEDAEHNLKFTKCDAVMSAWGLMVNPYLFDAKRTMKYGKYLPLKASLEYLKMVDEYGVKGEKSIVNGHLRDFFGEKMEQGIRSGNKRLQELKPFLDSTGVKSMRPWITCVESIAVELGLQKKLWRTRFLDESYRTVFDRDECIANGQIKKIYD